MIGDPFAQKPKDLRDQLDNCSYLEDLSLRISRKEAIDLYDVERLCLVSRNIKEEKERGVRDFHAAHPESMGR